MIRAAADCSGLCLLADTYAVHITIGCSCGFSRGVVLVPPRFLHGIPGPSWGVSFRVGLGVSAQDLCFSRRCWVFRAGFEFSRGIWVCDMFKGIARPLPSHTEGKPREHRPGYLWYLDLIEFRYRSEEGCKWLMVLTDAAMTNIKYELVNFRDVIHAL